ncbi:MAG: hypothetical protein AAF352_06090 [Pseudomonadota bacterium]
MTKKNSNPKRQTRATPPIRRSSSRAPIMRKSSQQTPSQAASSFPKTHNQQEAIAQLNFHYDALQDRIMLRANTNLHRELEIWITFRMFRLLCGAFDQIEELHVPKEAPMASKQAAKEIKRDADLAKSEFTQEYAQEEMEKIFGDTPLLVERVDINVKKKILQLNFQGSGLQCSVPVPLENVAAIHLLLMRCAAQAEWQDLPEDTPQIEDITKAQSGSRTLH